MSSTDLRDINEQASQALKVAENDGGASPVLVAVVREFAKKATKALDFIGGSREWEAVVEVEQAADSAKAAAEADAGAASETTSAIQDAHLAICTLKAGRAPAAL